MKTVPLHEICDIVVGRTPPRADPAMWGGTAPWVSIADMNQGHLIRHTKECISPEAAARGKRITPGTVLLSFKLSIGKVARAGIPLYTNEAIAALPVIDRYRVDENYLLRALQQLDLTSGSNRAAMGATLNKAALRMIRVPLPDIAEQRRIAAILDQADAVRAKRQTYLDKLVSLSPAWYEHHFPSETQGRGDVRTLAQWVDPARPITYGILKPGPDTIDGVPYVRVADMQQGEINLASIRRTSLAIAKSYKRSTLQAGDILMSIRGHVGRTAMVPSELEGGNITQDSARIAVIDPIEALYVRGAIESNWAQRWMRQRIRGVAVQGINLGDLRLLPIPAPPKDLMEHFATLSATLKSTIDRTKKAAALEDTLFTSLQSRAFRGEL